MKAGPSKVVKHRKHSRRGVNKIPPNFDTLQRLYKSFGVKGLIEHDSRSYSHTKQGGRGRVLPEVLPTMSGLQEQVCVLKDSTSRVTRLGFILVLPTANYS